MRTLASDIGTGRGNSSKLVALAWRREAMADAERLQEKQAAEPATRR
jgi:hypothetical protein